MAYVKTNWSDKVVSTPNKYRDQNNVPYTFTPDEGVVTSAGTPVSAGNLNKIESGLYDASVLLDAVVGIKTVTLSTAWSGTSAPYTQVVTVSGVTANDEPIISPIYSSTLATALLEKDAWSMVNKAVTGTDSITFTCFEDKPVTAITVQVKGV